ncbi:methyltransferase [Saccharothrix sp. NRRL B-16348]|uniref:methyltransferase n=1 Tax=Saccharothrix sp. NRRL B-16348 TaxID=1415542 RepID=UPI0006AE48FA|nr:methyltransferase [Saccharothrix sp. NRRL B-16348]KOX24504.1 methyltransferase [Saccharothrix sp. NRRL B-16348]
MSVTVSGAPGALGERDLRRLAETVAFARDRSTGDALAAVLGGDPPGPLLRHLEFARAAVLVAAVAPADVIGVLADLGVDAREPRPGVVVRDRLRLRTGQEFDVRIMRGPVAGGPREVELIVVPGGSALSDADREAESHVAFHVPGDDDVLLRGVCGTLRDAGLSADGGYHDDENVTVLHFRGATRMRLELKVPGRHAALLERHVGRPDQPRRSMLDLMTGAWRTRAVAVVAELGIADLLADGPADTAELADRTGCRADKLRRVLAYLAALGVFRRDGERWSLTEVGTVLRGDVAGSQRDLARIYGGLFYRSFSGLEHAVRTGESGFSHVYGAQPFEHFAAHPADARLFEGAMAAGTSFLELVPGLLDLPATGTVVDVAGGDGRLLDLVLTAAPGLRGVLFDRPHVVGAAADVLVRHGARASVVAGDFFHDPVPPGGDLYLLSRILHDWDDARCSVILRNVRAAMAEGATLAVVERPIQDDPRTLLPLAFNVHMMVNTVQGGERTTDEHRRLLAANGFALEDIRELPLDMAVLVARATV